MMKVPRVLGGIVRAIVIILLRRKPREQQSLRLEFPKADSLWRRKRALQETESRAETNENRFWENLSFEKHPASSVGKSI